MSYTDTPSSHTSERITCREAVAHKLGDRCHGRAPPTSSLGRTPPALALAQGGHRHLRARPRRPPPPACSTQEAAARAHSCQGGRCARSLGRSQEPARSPESRQLSRRDLERRSSESWLATGSSQDVGKSLCGGEMEKAKKEKENRLVRMTGRPSYVRPERADARVVSRMTQTLPKSGG
jgi:hypothetical protein